MRLDHVSDNRLRITARAMCFPVDRVPQAKAVLSTLSRVAFGTVKQWNGDEGWGALSSPEVSGEVWAHFSHIVDEADGYRSLSDGERVRFGYEHPGQDGYFWRAIWVVGLSDHSEYAVLTEEQIIDRIRQIDGRCRRLPTRRPTEQGEGRSG